MSKIYLYDNYTGIELPQKINGYEVEILLGNTISEIHKNIEDFSFMLCTFTHTPDADFIVFNNKDKEELQSLLEFGKLDYTIEVKSNSIWCSNKVKKNIIISDSVKLSSKELSILLSGFTNDIINDTTKVIEIYHVVNTRKGEEVIVTPIWDEAVRHCNKTASGVIYNSKEEILYIAKKGKTPTPIPSINKANKKLKNHYNIANIKIT